MVAAQYEDHLIRGRPFDLKLSAVDQVQFPIYSRRILIFSRPTSSHHDQTVAALKSGLQRTVDEIPFLAGQMAYAPEGGWSVSPGAARLRVKHIPDLSFAALEAAGFPEAMLPDDLVCSVPAFGDPWEEWHSCRVQANFIEGGLLLVVSILHSVMDGYGITRAIKALARHCRLSTTSDPAPGPITTDKPWTENRSQFFASLGKSSPADASKLAYTVDPSAQYPNLAGNDVTRTFRIAGPALAALKKQASSSNPGGTDWTTTHDAVSALFWRVQARARLAKGHIASNEEEVRFMFPVDFRKVVRGHLPEGYVGNAILMNGVVLKVKTLLAPGDEGLRAGAAAIRAGIREVDAGYVDNFVAVAESLDKPMDLKISVMLEGADALFGCTSYKNFDLGGVEWDAVVGKYVKMRLPKGIGARGVFIVLPVLADRSWEVTLTMDEDIAGMVGEDEELKRYTS